MIASLGYRRIVGSLFVAFDFSFNDIILQFDLAISLGEADSSAPSFYGGDVFGKQ
jgi:hypothetical protein